MKATPKENEQKHPFNRKEREGVEETKPPQRRDIPKKKLRSSVSIDLEDLVGKTMIDILLKEVCAGNFFKAEAEEFAYNLHPDVGGSFKNDRKEANLKYDRSSVEKILGNWYKWKAHELNKKESISQLKKAVAAAEMNVIVYELNQVSTENN